MSQPTQPASTTPALDAESRKGIFGDTLRATVSFEFASALQSGIYNNFVVEVLHISPAQLGLVRGLQEVPGLFTAALAVFAGYLRENVWAGICMLIAAMGFGLYAMTFSFPMLIASTLVVSVGQHLFRPTQQSIIIKSQLPEERATKMGMLNSGAAAASLTAYLIVIAVSRYVVKVNYSLMHAIAAVFAFLGAFMVMTRRITNTSIARRKIEFNPRYKSFYIMTFLSGARRHVTMTFAGYLMVQVYHTPVAMMVVLSAISSLIAIFTRPAIGRLIDNMGEQRCLMVNYLIAIPVFLAYGYLRWPALIFVAYIIDNATSGFDVAIQTHLGKIAAHESLSNSFAMGSTIMHIAGVGVPMVGGVLWDMMGSPVVFLMGALFATISLIYSQQLDRIEKTVKNLTTPAA